MTKAKPKAKKSTKVVPLKKTTTPTFIALDLGCGDNKTSIEALYQIGMMTEEQSKNAKVIGVDLYKTPSVDKVHDLTKFPYPFEDNSIDAVHTSHFLEHLDGRQRIQFFNEMYRIMKKGAKMRHIHPYYKSSRAVQDPTHAFPPICEESYLYWTKEFREANKLGHYLGDCDFSFTIFYTFQDPVWMNKNEETRNFAIRHYFNVVADMIVDMVKK